MADQLRFQRMIDGKLERSQIFEVLLDLQSKLIDLQIVLSETSSWGTTLQDIATQQRIEHKWNQLEAAILPCEKTLIPAVHLSQSEKNYFLDYAMRVDGVTRRRTLNTPQMSSNALKEISEEYKDFTKKLMQAASPSK